MRLHYNLLLLKHYLIIVYLKRKHDYQLSFKSPNKLIFAESKPLLTMYFLGNIFAKLIDLEFIQEIISTKNLIF